MTKKKVNRPDLTSSEGKKRIAEFAAKKGIDLNDAKEAIAGAAKKSLPAQLCQSARIRCTASGECYYEQSGIRFSVDGKDLTNVVGCNGGINVVGRLMDSEIANLATANLLPIQPFARELLIPVLTGLVQLTWYRDLENHESDHLNENQQKRVMNYLEALKTYVEETSDGDSKKRVARVKADKYSRSFVLATGKHDSISDGREKQIFEVVRSIKGGTFAEIVKAADGKVKTIQSIEKIVDRFLGKLVSKGVLTVKAGA